MQVDQSFLQDWAESLSRGIKRKREDENEDASESNPSNTLDPSSLGLLEPKLELLEPQVELQEEGLSSCTEVKQEEVKIDKPACLINRFLATLVAPHFTPVSQ